MVAAVDRAGQQVWSPRKRGRESPVRSPWTNPSALDTRQTIVTGSIYGYEFYVLQSRSLLRYKIKRDFSPCSADGNILFRTIETNEIRSSNISSCTNFPYFIKNLIFPYSLNFFKFSYFLKSFAFCCNFLCFKISNKSNTFFFKLFTFFKFFFFKGDRWRRRYLTPLTLPYFTSI